MVDFISFPKRKLRKMIQKGDYKEAIEFGESIEKKYQNDPDFLFIMGSIYYILEDAKIALYYFDRVLASRKNDVEALLLKAEIHLFLKEFDKVKECCDLVQSVEPDNKRAEEILDHIDSN